MDGRIPEVGEHSGPVLIIWDCCPAELVSEFESTPGPRSDGANPEEMPEVSGLLASRSARGRARADAQGRCDGAGSEENRLQPSGMATLCRRGHFPTNSFPLLFPGSNAFSEEH